MSVESLDYNHQPLIAEEVYTAIEVFESGNRLSANEERDILHFVLLWGKFERIVPSQKKRRHANIIWEWATGKTIPNQECFLKLFQDRYYDNNSREFQPAYKECLWRDFNNKDNKECQNEVDHVIKGGNDHVLSALLVLIYRIRNNLFHGLKQFDLKAQLKVLPIANRVLLEALELYQPSE